jgi:hypothetical protein
MTKIGIAEIFLNEVVEKLSEVFPEPAAQKPAEKEASNTTGGSWEEEGEILNPFIEAQRVLGKVEAAADELDTETKTRALIEVAKVHSEIGKQLLEEFIR